MSTPEALRRRATWTLFTGVALGTTGLFAAVTAGPIAADDITGSARLSGLPYTMSIIGTAVGAAILSRVMAARGRRPGLALGYACAAAGAFVAVAGIRDGTYLPLLPGMLLIGVGNGSNQLARFASADLQPPHRRGFGLSLVVWAGTIGAFVGPNMLGVAGDVAASVDRPRLAGPFAFIGAGFALAVVIYMVLLRPDPSELADRTETEGLPGRTALTGAWRVPSVRIAVVSLAFAQGVMVLIMTMTPVQVRRGGGDLAAAGFVMSAHIVGMYAFSPIAGKLGDRLGRRPVIGAGFVMLAAAGVVAALLHDAGGRVLAAPLFVLGLGWSFAFVAASALLTEGFAYEARAKLQGSADTIVFTAAAASSFGSGFLLGAAGYVALCVIGALLVAVPAAVLVGTRLPALAGET